MSQRGHNLAQVAISPEANLAKLKPAAQPSAAKCSRGGTAVQHVVPGLHVKS